MGERLEAMNEQISTSQADLQMAAAEKHDLRRKLDEAQAGALKAASDYEGKKQMINQLLREKDSLLSQLAKQEDAAQRLQAENDDMKGKLGHHSKVRSMVEEQFSSELTALHQQNSELKVSLNASTLAKQDLQKRLENVQAMYAQADARLDQLSEQVRAAQADAASMQRQADLVRAEKGAAEAELQDKLGTIARLEMEMQRLKRGDIRKVPASKL